MSGTRRTNKEFIRSIIEGLYVDFSQHSFLLAFKLSTLIHTSLLNLQAMNKFAIFIKLFYCYICVPWVLKPLYIQIHGDPQLTNLNFLWKSTCTPSRLHLKNFWLFDLCSGGFSQGVIFRYVFWKIFRISNRPLQS